MPQHKSPERITLSPDWKYFLIGYALSILLIPIFGIGLVALYFVRRNHISFQYIITNSRISRIDQQYQHNVDLIDIRSINLEQNWWQQKLGIGTIILHTSASKMELEGLKEPEKIRAILEQAIQSEIKRQEQAEQTHKKQTDYNPGSMEKMDYLTGLWQQGLISDEDFESERRHFE